MSGGPTLIYDEDCAFCQRCVEVGRRRLRRFPATVGFQSADLPSFGITRTEAEHSVWLCLPSGQRRHGADAVASILLVQPAARWSLLGTLMRLPILRAISVGAYALVARYRQHMPGATAWCRRPGM